MGSDGLSEPRQPRYWNPRQLQQHCVRRGKPLQTKKEELFTLGDVLTFSEDRSATTAVPSKHQEPQESRQNSVDEGELARTKHYHRIAPGNEPIR
jgi:hypothetical protein